MPDKLFEYGMAGLPIPVSDSDLPEMKSTIEQYECSAVCPGITIASSMKRILSMDIDHLGANARVMAEGRCREKQENVLVSLCHGLFSTLGR